MSLSQRLRGLFPKNLGRQLGFHFAVITTTGFFIFFFSTYLALTSALRKEDRELLHVQTLRLGQIFSEPDLRIASEQALKTLNSSRRMSAYFVFVFEGDALVFTYRPIESDRGALKRILGHIQKGVHVSAIPLLKDDENIIDLEGAQLPLGRRLVVGQSSEEREAFFRRFRTEALWIAAPLILISLLLGFIISRGLLRPIRRLIEAMRLNLSGNRGARVPLEPRSDEIGDLMIIFNSLTESNSKLIQALQDSLEHTAHDLRTPLARMKIICEQNLESQEVPPRLREALEELSLEISEVISLLNSISEVTGIESGLVVMGLDKVSIKSVLESVVELYEYVAAEKNLEVDWECAEDSLVKGDRQRLRRAFANIVDNAIKFSPQGSRIKIFCQRRGGRVRVEVRDWGPGISDEDLPQIWEKLYRGDKSRSTPGFGLGLSISKAIIESHGGRISVHNLKPQGAEFLIELPLA